MKPRATLGVLSLALALLAVVPSPASPAGSSPGVPAPSPNEGCAGETYQVSMVRHAFSIDREHAPGNRSATGFLRITDFDLTVTGTFVNELRDGKHKWVSRTVDWKGQSSDNVPECHSVSCDAAGHLELGSTDRSERVMTNDQEAQMKWHCKPIKHTGNCFGYFPFTPASVPFPEIRATLDQLRSGCCYSAVDRDGTRYSETVEQRGNEEIEIGVEHGSASINPDAGVAALNLRLTCDQIPINDAKVDVEVDPQKNTGGHMHDTGTGRPRGKLEWKGSWKTLTDKKPSIQVKTDDDGRAHLNFKPGKAKDRDNVGIAGIYQVTAKSLRFPNPSATGAVTAEVKGLFENKATGNGNYIVCRPSWSCNGDKGNDDDPAHKEGTHATTTTLASLANMAADFKAAQEKHNAELKACGAKPWTPRPLRVLDVALPMGGLLDIDGDWSTPHQTHGKGIAIDFGVNAWSDNTIKTCYSSGESRGEGITTERGWLMTTMMQVGENYGHWDAYDLCQHPNVCAGWKEQPWVKCCPDNITCPKWEGGPGMMGPPCPGLPYPEAQCLHCPTDQLWHLWFNQ